MADGDGSDRGITRDPIMRAGDARRRATVCMEDKVWFDAPIEYIACAQEWRCDRWSGLARWWRTDKGADE
jgi:methionyl-tRNA synthetase